MLHDSIAKVGIVSCLKKAQPTFLPYEETFGTTHDTVTVTQHKINPFSIQFSFN